MCLTTSDMRLEFNRKFKELNRKKKFKVKINLYEEFGEIIAQKTVSTPDGYFDFCASNGVHIHPEYIFETFIKALNSIDERSIEIHHFTERN